MAAAQGMAGGVTLQQAILNTSSATTSHIITALGTMPIYVVSYTVSSIGIQQVTFQDTTGTPVVLEGPLYFGANGVGALTASTPPPAYLFATTAGQGLDVVTGQAIAVAVRVVYFVGQV